MFTQILVACGLGAYAAGGSVIWTPALLLGVLINRSWHDRKDD